MAKQLEHKLTGMPAFYIKRSSDTKHHSTLYFTQGGHEAQPAYALRHLDPSSPASKNRYAVGISDAFIPDVLYGEVLIIPKWTQPSLSQDAIRANGGVPPPPEPILPTEFTIQLYNPEQQVKVRHRPKTWNTSAAWEFEMPQQTFRTPSASALDKSMSDPAASDITPKLSFNWRKEGRKDLGCYLSGKTADMADGTRKKSKEPDITVAIFKGLKEVTLYEPNLYRVEMEDFKGLELVLLLGAVVIRDVYFGSMKDCFHISSPGKAGSPTTKNNSNNIPVAVGGGVRVNGQPKTNGAQPANHPPIQPPSQNPQGTPGAQQRPQRPKLQVQPPPADPRTQWELDQETRGLQQQSEAEARERRRREKEAEKRTKKLLEEEQKVARRRQAEIDQETERLKKLYGKEEAAYRKQQQKQQAQQRRLSSRPPPPSVHVHPPHTHSRPHLPPRPHNRLSSLPEGHASTFLRPQQPPRPMSTVGAPGGLRPPQSHGQQPGRLRERRSIFDLFKRGEERPKTLHKKQSSLF